MIRNVTIIHRIQWNRSSEAVEGTLRRSFEKVRWGPRAEVWESLICPISFAAWGIKYILCTLWNCGIVVLLQFISCRLKWRYTWLLVLILCHSLYHVSTCQMLGDVHSTLFIHSLQCIQTKTKTITLVQKGYVSSVQICEASRRKKNIWFSWYMGFCIPWFTSTEYILLFLGI